MKPFRYARPETLDDALVLLKEYGPAATLLAGGTDVLVRLRAGRTPKIVIDLKRISALRSDIAEADGCLRIGALALLTDIAEDARMLRHFPALVDAIGVVGSIQIRNRATLAGNICNASPAADTVPPLLVYGAKVNLVGTEGRRKVELAKFFTGPGKTVMNRDEMVESIDLPVPPGPNGASFGRITRRRGVDLATINLCCRVSPTGETRFAFGAVGPTPFLVTDTTGVLASPESDRQKREDILKSMIAHASPISNVRGSREYRIAMLHVSSRRCLEEAIERLRQAETTR
jgi:CO/xanthine dehydrogenase FAD-binding subunit